MTRNIYSAILALILLLASCNSMADIRCQGPASNVAVRTTTLNLSNPSINWSGPANQLAVGKSPANWSSSATNTTVFSCLTNFFITADTGNPQLWAVAKISPSTGITYTENGVSYPVYSTGATGIGYIVGVADPNQNLKPLGSTALQFLSTANGAAALGVKYQFRYVITGPLRSGITNIPSQTVGEIQLRDGSTNIIGTSSIMLSSATLTVTAATCAVNTSNIAVSLPAATISSLTNAGSTSIPARFNISLTCPSGINTYMVFTDNSNMGNTSNQLSLSAGSTAKGIAVQIRKADGSVVNFGPDSVNPGAINQFLALNNLSGTQVIPFSASIIRTAAITPGSYTAVATFTFSYQ